MTILLLETIHAEAQALLESYDRVRLASTADAVREAVEQEQVVAIVTRGRGEITAGLMAACPVLRAVARCGVGLDNIDSAAAAARGVAVIYAPGSTTHAVAEHTLMLMLAAARRLVAAAVAVRARGWEFRNGYQGYDLAGRTLGVVGMGAIGQRVAWMAEGLGMRVIYWSRRRRSPEHTYVELPELLASADVISLHVELTPETTHLISERELALVRPGAILINTSRGAVVDQGAVATALRAGRLGSFAADVLEREPPAPDEALLDDERVILTPHIAALTDVTYRAMCLRTAVNLLAVLRGEQPEAASLYRGHHSGAHAEA
jgi:phosphoglycerate dehydrogenase-like enzyme